MSGFSRIFLVFRVAFFRSSCRFLRVCGALPKLLCESCVKLLNLSLFSDQLVSPCAVSRGPWIPGRDAGSRIPGKHSDGAGSVARRGFPAYECVGFVKFLCGRRRRTCRFFQISLSILSRPRSVALRPSCRFFPGTAQKTAAGRHPDPRKPGGLQMYENLRKRETNRRLGGGFRYILDGTPPGCGRGRQGRNPRYCSHSGEHPPEHPRGGIQK